MENVIFVPWGDFKPVPNPWSCPCCMGVKRMPDGEELEQRLLENLDLLGFEKQNKTNENKREQNTTKGGDSE